jgi:4-aminobutyrate aminotransferase-like enzyme
VACWLLKVLIMRCHIQEINVIVAAMKEKGVLLGTDGPYHNVIKIKPPLVVTKRDVDLFVDALDATITDVLVPDGPTQARL